MNPDGMVALLDFREDGVTPYMIFFKDGLEIEKCVSTDLNWMNVPNYMISSFSVSLVLSYLCWAVTASLKFT